MIKQKKISVSIFSIIFISIFLITQLTACYKEDNTDDINQIQEFQEIELTKANFFDYYIEDTTSWYRGFDRSMGELLYLYEVDYSITCKYVDAVSNDVSVSFSFETSPGFEGLKKMHLTGARACSYISYDCRIRDYSGKSPTSGFRIRISTVKGTIKIPKNSY